jgi:hypothetical protein
VISEASEGEFGAAPRGGSNPDFSYWLGFEGRSRQLHADIVAMKGRNLCESWRA